jgi:hypothetical protein
MSMVVRLELPRRQTQGPSALYFEDGGWFIGAACMSTTD